MTPAQPLAIFRADADHSTGGGHIMRCKALADTFRAAGWQTRIATRHTTLDIMHTLLDACDCLTLDADSPRREAIAIGNALGGSCDLMVVDHYGIDRAFETAARGYSHSILVIDDLANRQHDCDWLLDQGGTRQARDYEGFVPPMCNILLGPRYAMLRHEFLLRRIGLNRKTAFLKRILVSLGATDSSGLTLMALDGIAATRLPVAIDIVAAAASPNLNAIRQRMATLPSTQSACLHLDTQNMAGLVESADLAIGAGGMTSLERCCLGLPSLMIIVADNQRENAAALANADAAVILGEKTEVTAEAIAGNITTLYHDGDARRHLSQSASRLCDGLGTRRIMLRIASGEIAVDGQPVSLRPATAVDTDMVYAWQIAPETRAFARNPKCPTQEEHNSWMTRCLADDSVMLNIILHGETPSGVLRLDRQPASDGGALKMEVSIYVAPGHYRLGIAHCALSLARKLVPESEFLAEVLPGNTASHALFQKAGFIQDGDLYHLAAQA